MGLFRTLFRHCRTYNRSKTLPGAGSGLTKAIATIAACGLIFSSAGFASVFAYQSGLPHGPLFAGLMVAMAVSLELAKPLAVASALTAFRSWAIVRGVLLAALGLVAIGFSLCAELQLVSSSRNAVVDGRAGAIEQSDVRRGQLKAAQQELAALPPSRPIEEVRADITRLQAQSPKAGDCKRLDNPTARWVCPKVAALNGEAARTKRRGELQAIVDAKADQLATAGAVRVADPGSHALATYLATLGVNVPSTLLSDWLILVPVLALELGAALALVLVQAVSAPATASVIELRSEHRAETQPGQPQSAPKPVEPAQPDPKPDPNRPSKRTKKRKANRTRRDAKKRLGNVVRLVRSKGGKLTASQSSMAKQLKLSKTRTHELLRELEGAGIVKVKTTKRGTSVRLAG